MDRASTVFRLVLVLLLAVVAADLYFGIRYLMDRRTEARLAALESRFVAGGGDAPFLWSHEEDRELVAELLRSPQQNRLLLGLAILVDDPADPAIPRELADPLEGLVSVADDRRRLFAALALGQAVRYHRSAKPAAILAVCREPRPLIGLALEAGLLDGRLHTEPCVGHSLSQPDRAELVLAGLGPDLILALETLHAALPNANLLSAAMDPAMPLGVRIRAAVVLAQRRDLSEVEKASLASSLSVRPRKGRGEEALRKAIEAAGGASGD